MKQIDPTAWYGLDDLSVLLDVGVKCLAGK